MEVINKNIYFSYKDCIRMTELLPENLKEKFFEYLNDKNIYDNEKLCYKGFFAILKYENNDKNFYIPVKLLFASEEFRHEYLLDMNMYYRSFYKEWYIDSNMAQKIINDIFNYMNNKKV